MYNVKMTYIIKRREYRANSLGDSVSVYLACIACLCIDYSCLVPTVHGSGW